MNTLIGSMHNQAHTADRYGKTPTCLWYGYQAIERKKIRDRLYSLISVEVFENHRNSDIIQTLLKHAVETNILAPELSECSPVFLAVLGYLVGVNITHPVLIGLQVTFDGMILTRHEGDLGFDHALGVSHMDLLRNLNGLCDALSVSTEQRKKLFSLCQSLDERIYSCPNPTE